MRLENSFDVPAPPEQAWALLMDVPRVVPCMPGAELTETVDAEHWKARLQVKLGPIALAFLTDLTREAVDEAERRVTLRADAREQRGRGAARAAIESRLAPLNGGTRVDVVTELTLSGAVAQYGRGVVADVAGQMVSSFADCLRAQLVGSEQEAQRAVAAQARPVSGLRLGLGAVGRALARLFRRRQPNP